MPDNVYLVWKIEKGQTELMYVVATFRLGLESLKLHSEGGKLRDHMRGTRGSGRLMAVSERADGVKFELTEHTINL